MSKRIPFLIGFILLMIALWVQTTSIPYIQSLKDRLDHLAYDVQLRTKLFTHRQKFHPDVVIVDIDDKSLSKMGRWPWPRAELAALISRIQEQGAVVIGLDMLFPEQEQNIVDIISQELTKQKLETPGIEPILNQIKPLFDEDSKLSSSLKQIDSILGISFLPRPLEEGLLPAPLMILTTPAEQNFGFIKSIGYIGNIQSIQTSAKSAGFINVYPDDDGVIRRVPLLLRYNNFVYPSLALEAVRIYLLSNVKLMTGTYGSSRQIEGVQIANHTIPTDEKGQVIVPFRGKSFSFPYYSAIDVLNKKIPSDALQGKIVFIGTSATGLGDLPATAVQSSFPGVEIQATIVDGILSDNFAFKPAWSLGAEVFFTGIFGIILVFLFPFLGPRLLSLFVIIIPALLIFGNNELWEKTGLILSILIPMIFTIILGVFNIVYGYLFESRRRERLKEIFGQYVPAKHIDEMLQTTGSYGMLGEEREMTVLFADIRNFTTISEHMPASQLKELLNEFFTPMTEIIFKHRGTIDKYVGDLIMAFWGAPLKDKRHAQHAVSAAIDMQFALKDLQSKMEARGWPLINIGIGLNSGMMSVGDMGSKFRRNYTVLGDAVNLASRVEGLSKYYGVSTIVTENVVLNQKLFLFRLLDRVRVKGKETGIGIYEVVGRLADLPAQALQEVELSQEAINYYFNREWKKSSEIFHILKNTYPHVKLYTLYLHRLDEYEKTPPPKDWDGIFSHTSK